MRNQAAADYRLQPKVKVDQDDRGDDDGPLPLRLAHFLPRHNDSPRPFQRAGPYSATTTSEKTKQNRKVGGNFLFLGRL